MFTVTNERCNPEANLKLQFNPDRQVDFSSFGRNIYFFKCHINRRQDHSIIRFFYIKQVLKIQHEAYFF